MPLTDIGAHASTSGSEGEDHAALLDNAAPPASRDIADNPLSPSSEATGAVATRNFQDDQQEIRRPKDPFLVGSDATTTSSSDDHRPEATRTGSYESSAGPESLDMRHRMTWPRNETGTYLPLRDGTDTA